MKAATASPTSPLYAAARLPISSNPISAHVAAATASAETFRVSGITNPTLMTAAMMPSSSSGGVGGESSVVTPEMIKQPILLTLSTTGTPQQLHSSQQRSAHRMVPSSLSTTAVPTATTKGKSVVDDEHEMHL
jgi:hypothetical protein